MDKRERDQELHRIKTKKDDSSVLSRFAQKPSTVHKPDRTMEVAFLMRWCGCYTKNEKSHGKTPSAAIKAAKALAMHER